jgi:hypothetical protein
MSTLFMSARRARIKHAGKELRVLGVLYDLREATDRTTQTGCGIEGLAAIFRARGTVR